MKNIYKFIAKKLAAKAINPDQVELLAALGRFFGTTTPPASLKDATRLVEKQDILDEGILESLMQDKDVNDDVVAKRATGMTITNIRHYMPTIKARFRQQRGMYAMKSVDALVAEQKAETVHIENTRLINENAALSQSLANKNEVIAQLQEKLSQTSLSVVKFKGNPMAAELSKAQGIIEGSNAAIDKLGPLLRPAPAARPNNGGGNNNNNGNNNGGNRNNRDNRRNNDSDDNRDNTANG